MLYTPFFCMGQQVVQQVIASTDGTQLKALLAHPNELAITKPRPVVIALHGCGGLYATTGPNQGKLNARHAGMAQLITANGYSIIFPDSFSSRGQSSLCSQKFSNRKIKQTNRSDDVDGVLLWLEDQSWADKSKIALLGWSHGGSTVLRSIDANRQKVSTRKLQPSTAVAFYPGCSYPLRENFRPQIPLTMMVAELDDWTPAAPCIQLAKLSGSNIHVYADSYHGFDNPIGNVRLRRDVPNAVNFGKGAHVGRNPTTGPQAWNQLLLIFRDQWE